MSGKKNGMKGNEEPMTPAEEQAKVKELRALLGPLSGRSLLFCTDDCLARYLRARSWHVKKADKMLKEAIKWRASYKPEDVRWEEVSKESETGKVYKSNFVDKLGRSVIVMRPGNQNTTDHNGQIRQLVYTIENAIINLPPDQEQMVWLIDFKGWSMRKAVPIATARETAYILQTMYPERLSLAILYDPPKLFETFWAIVKPFLDPKTFRKVKFVYSKNQESSKIFQDLFDMDQLEVSFGGRNTSTFNFVDYGNQMKEDDIKTARYWSSDPATMKLDSHTNGSPAANGTHATPEETASPVLAH